MNTRSKEYKLQAQLVLILKLYNLSIDIPVNTLLSIERLSISIMDLLSLVEITNDLEEENLIDWFINHRYKSGYLPFTLGLYSFSFYSDNGLLQVTYKGVTSQLSNRCK